MKQKKDMKKVIRKEVDGAIAKEKESPMPDTSEPPRSLLFFLLGAPLARQLLQWRRTWMESHGLLPEEEEYTYFDDPEDEGFLPVAGGVDQPRVSPLETAAAPSKPAVLCPGSVTVDAKRPCLGQGLLVAAALRLPWRHTTTPPPMPAVSTPNHAREQQTVVPPRCYLFPTPPLSSENHSSQKEIFALPIS